MSKEVMKLALEVLKINLTLLKKINPYKGQEDLLSDSLGLTNKAITALREALAKPDFWEGYVPEPVEPAQQALDKMVENARELGLDYEPAQQEPVAYLCENAVGHQYFRWKKPSSEYKPIALYTSPPAQRTWVGLTNKDVYECEPKKDWYDSVEFARAIEAKLKEKNT